MSCRRFGIGSWLAVLMTAFVTLTTPTSFAAPTKTECVAASKEGQALRRAGKLRGAVERFAQCVASSCSQAQQKECTALLKEAKEATPRFVFLVKERNGPDIRAKVTVDGTPAVLVTSDSSYELAIDPGEHVFEFSADGFTSQTIKHSFQEGATYRETVVLEKQIQSTPSSSPDANRTSPPTAASTTTASQASESSPADPNKNRIQLALRVGAAVGVGNAADFYKPQTSIFVTIGKRLDQHLFFGGYGGVGFGSSSKAICESPELRDLVSSCDAHGAFSLRLGPEFQYHIVATEVLDPWVGAGIGFAITHGSLDFRRATDGSVVPFDYSAFGIDFLRASVGLDVRPSSILAFGPVVEALLGSYGDSEKLDGQDLKLKDTSHGEIWFTFGLRGVLFP